jgi:hypothetical protein
MQAKRDTRGSADGTDIAVDGIGTGQRIVLIGGRPSGPAPSLTSSTPTT